MSLRLEARGLVAAHAKRVALGVELAGMRIVAVGAAHARLIHTALQERAPFVHLALDLTVGVISTRAQEFGCKRVQEWITRNESFPQRLPTAVARSANLDLHGVLRTRRRTSRPRRRP